MRLSPALVFLVVACSPPPTHERAPAPRYEQDFLLNGKHHVLRFEHDASPLDALAVGAAIQLGVGQVPVVGHTVGASRWSAGARIDLLIPAGLEVTREVRPDFVDLKVRCAKPGVFELGFTATDPDGTTSTDAIDLGCHSAARLEVDLGEGLQSGVAKYAVGGTIVVYVNRFAADGLQLWGDAEVTVTPASAALVEPIPQQFTHLNEAVLRARALGHDVSVRSTGVTVGVPVEIVDAPDWHPELVITRTEFAPGQVFFHAQSRLLLPDQSPLFGLSGCAFESFVGAVSTAQPTGESCSLWGTAASSAFDADRLCVTIQGRRACTDLAR